MGTELLRDEVWELLRDRCGASSSQLLRVATCIPNPLCLQEKPGIWIHNRNLLSD